MLSRRTLVSTALLAGAGMAVGGPVRAGSMPPTLLTPTQPDLSQVSNSGAWVCWVGHSTVLINLFGTWILTDPVLFENFGVRILGVTVGPRRYIRPALTVDQIPMPDLVLLSHAHIDHMDVQTLLAISGRFPDKVDVITATNTADVINDMPWRSLNEMDWTDTANLHGCSVQALQVTHNGNRFPGEPCRSNGYRRAGRSYNGYLVERNGIRIVFGGDTAYTTSFRDVRGEVDIAIMPIGAYQGYHNDHCTPEEALAMAEMMRARHVVPIHHATFNMSPEPRLEPIARLRRAMQRSTTQLATQGIGDVLRVDAT